MFNPNPNQYYLRSSLPLIRALAAKVRGAHGDHNPKLRDLDDAVVELSEMLLAPLEQDDYDEVGRLLERIRAASDEYVVPEWGCTSYHMFFAELRRLDQVLAPRFAPGKVA